MPYISTKANTLFWPIHVTLIVVGGLLSLCSSCHKDFYFVGETVINWADSLALTVNLNDSVFAYGQVNEFLVNKVDMRWKGPSSSILTLDRPLAEVTITNKGKHPIKVPYQQYWITANGDRHKFSAIIYEFGTDDNKVKSQSGADKGFGIEYPMVNSNYFFNLGPHRSIDLQRIIDILLFATNADLPVGKYWLLICLQNYWVEGGKNDYFIGKVCSDTLWFRIVEDSQ